MISVETFDFLSSLPQGAACTMLLIYMFCTDCWLIAAIYTAWLIIDWNTPKEGNALTMAFT